MLHSYSKERSHRSNKITHTNIHTGVRKEISLGNLFLPFYYFKIKKICCLSSPNFY